MEFLYSVKTQRTRIWIFRHKATEIPFLQQYKERAESKVTRKNIIQKKECSPKGLLLQEKRAQENARKKRCREEAVRTVNVRGTIPRDVAPVEYEASPA